MATFGTNPAIAPDTPPARPSTWFTIEGVLLILLGVLALVDAFVAGAVAASLLGVLIFLGGVLGLVSTFRGGHTHRTWSVVSAAIAIAAGLAIAIFPVFGASLLALIVAVYLLIDGVSMIMLSLDQRKRHSGRWGWLMAAGVADIVLALLVMLLNPVGATVLVGVIVAVDLVVAGVALIALGRGTPLALARRP